MRILDLDSNKSLANIIIYLTNLEAIELRETIIHIFQVRIFKKNSQFVFMILII
jgi:hypothetical protein